MDSFVELWLSIETLLAFIYRTNTKAKQQQVTINKERASVRHRAHNKDVNLPADQKTLSTVYNLFVDIYQKHNFPFIIAVS